MVDDLLLRSLSESPLCISFTEAFDGRPRTWLPFARCARSLSKFRGTFPLRFRSFRWTLFISFLAKIIGILHATLETSPWTQKSEVRICGCHCPPSGLVRC